MPITSSKLLWKIIKDVTFLSILKVNWTFNGVYKELL